MPVGGGEESKVGRLVMPGPHEAESQVPCQGGPGSHSLRYLSAERSSPAPDTLLQHHILKWGDLGPSQGRKLQAPDPSPRPASVLALLLCETSQHLRVPDSTVEERTWRALLWDFSALKGMGTLGPDCWGWAGARVLETHCDCSLPLACMSSSHFPF